MSKITPNTHRVKKKCSRGKVDRGTVSVIAVFRRLRQEDYKFEIGLGYIPILSNIKLKKYIFYPQNYPETTEPEDASV